MAREELPVKVFYEMVGDILTIRLMIDNEPLNLVEGDSIIIEHYFVDINPNVHAYIQRKER